MRNRPIITIVQLLRIAKAAEAAEGILLKLATANTAAQEFSGEVDPEIMLSIVEALSELNEELKPYRACMDKTITPEDVGG